MTLMIAQVVAVHAKRRTVDLVCVNTGARYPDAFMATGHSGTDFGSWETPSVPKPTNEIDAGGINKDGRTILAVCGLFFGRPIVLGFIRANDSMMAFNEDDRSVNRHASGTYHTTAPNGSTEIFHPAGAYVRIGTGEDHEDLTPISADKNWTLPEPDTGATIVVETKHKDGDGNLKGFKLIIRPTGEVVLTTDGDVSLTIHGDTTAQIDGNATVTVNKDVDLKSHQNITLDADENIALVAGGGVSITANGSSGTVMRSSTGPMYMQAQTISALASRINLN